MSITIPAVPDSIKRSELNALLARLGIDPDHVPLENGVHLGGHAVTATVFATDPNGKFYLDATSDAVAVHHIAIPVVDDLSTPQHD